MTPRRVLLIGWDAADWKVIRPLMDAGRMPNLRRLVENGASGQIATLHPPLSPMLWTSIATGKRPFKHGIHGFTEPMPDGRGVRPITNLSRTAKALWNIFTQNDLRSIVIGWWPSHPAEPIDGVMVSDHYHRAGGPFDEGWALPAGTVHPPEMGEKLASLRVHPDSLSADLIEPFIPLAREIDQDTDKRLGELMRTLAECMSIHAAADWLLDNQPSGGKPWDFFAVYYEAIDHFCHSFMRYHPPRQAWIGERDFELYRHVVSMAYQFHDEMLGDLLRKAGDDITVMLTSDHGFHPDHLRPASIPDIPAGPAIEHRDLGIFAMSGPGIKRNESLPGPSILDVTPTILALYGLPVGEDMDGKVLTQAFVKNPDMVFIPSWEEVPARDGHSDGRHPPHTRLDSAAAHVALEQMIALGYIERPPEDRESAARNTARELRYNLGQAYQDAGRHLEAREIFSDLREADPDELRFAVRLFASCQALGMREELQSIVEDLDQRKPGADQHSVIDYLKAQVLVADKKYAEALAALERVMRSQMASPGLFIETGDLYLRLGRSSDASEVYRKALAIDPDNAPAQLGVCRVALRQRKFGIAAHSALDALQAVHQSPMAHFLLGRALAGMKQYERAADTFRAAISFNPNFPEAHGRLAALLEKNLNDAETAREHRRLARSMRNRGRKHVIRQPEGAASVSTLPDTAVTTETGEMPPIEECLIVVSGLPRSGTSMLMQMLAAGGMAVISDGLREADEDNPRGYLEFEPVKNLLNDAQWLFGGRGKVVKIVAPLLTALPPGHACRVILIERDLDQVLDSQERMLARRKHAPPSTPARRRMLKEEYQRMLRRVKVTLAMRPQTQVLLMEHRNAISDAKVAAGKLNQFLGGGLDVAKMAGAVAMQPSASLQPHR